MFLGQYELRIDHKGRVSIPAKFKETFRAGLVLSQGFDRCLNVYALAEFGKVADVLASLPVTQISTRRVGRLTFSNAFDLQIDRQGRIVLPPTLRQYAEIKDEVVVVGARDHLEIWARKLWMEEMQYISEHAVEIAEAVGTRP